MEQVLLHLLGTWRRNCSILLLFPLGLIFVVVTSHFADMFILNVGSTNCHGVTFSSKTLCTLLLFIGWLRLTSPVFFFQALTPAQRCAVGWKCSFCWSLWALSCFSQNWRAAISCIPQLLVKQLETEMKSYRRF